MRSQHIGDDLEHFKYSARPSLIIELLPEIIGWKKAREVLVPNPFPRTFTEIEATPQLGSTLLEQEVAWTATILGTYQAKIEAFLHLRKNVERNLLTGNYRDGLAALDALEAEIGTSFWALEMRIFLIGACDGLDAQKEFSRAVKNDGNNHSIVRFFAHYCSLRCEPRVSPSRFEVYIDDAIKNHSEGRQDNEGIKDYIFYLLCFFGGHVIHNPSRLLATFGRFPIVDRYEALIRIVQLHTAFEGMEAIPVIKLAIHSQLKNCSDARISLLSAFANIQTRHTGEAGIKYLGETLDAYTNGSYDECVNLSSKALEAFPDIFTFAELYAKSHARLGMTKVTYTPSAVVEALLQDLVSILLKTPGSETAASNLRKRAYSLPGMRYSAQLMTFLMREYIYDPFYLPLRLSIFGGLNAEYFSPRLSTSFDDKSASSSFLQNLDNLYPGNTTTAFFNAYNLHTIEVDQLPESIAKDRMMLYKGRLLQLDRQLDAAATIYRELIFNPDYLICQDALLSLNRVEADRGEFGACFDLLVDAYIENQHLLSRLPFADIMQQAENLASSARYSNYLSRPIVYEILSRTAGSMFDARRDDSYEDFLLSNNVKAPSELAGITGRFPLKRLIYFLRYVCVQDVMDSSVAFKNSEELLQERIKICQILLTLDAQNSEVYSDEIKRITQSLIIQRGVREVEQSKIYVEVSGLRRWMEKTLRESFTRYIDLLNTSPEMGDANEMILELGKILGSNADRMQFLIPGNEVLALFREMFFEIRDQFLFSNEFGLDGYLSTGLRHGTLAGQLRSPFEAEHLITQRDEQTKVYKAPKFWLEAYAWLPVNTKNKISQCLQEFSMKIDEVIDTVRTQWIQISTDRKATQGLFDYRVSDVRLANLQSRINSKTTYNEFVDAVFEFLWEVTERNLQRIRQKIEDDLKEQFRQKVEELQNSISQMSLSYDLSGLNAAITRSLTSAQYAVDKTASWFTRAKSTDIGPYSLDLPIEIALAVIKNIFPSFNFSPNIDVTKEYKLEGKTLTSFSTIIFLLLDNVRKHCGIVDTSVAINVSFTVDSGKLNLEVTNDIAHISDSQIASVRPILSTYADAPVSFEKVPTEGGSGIQKLKRAFVVELSITPSIRFDILENRLFIASITFDANHLIHENRNN